MIEGDRNRAVVAEVVSHAWKDPAYLNRLKSNTKETLAQAGMSIPPDMDMIYVENSPTVINAVLPRYEDMPQFQSQVDRAVKLLDHLPDNVEVRIHRDSDARSYFVMPLAPRATRELSDAELEQVAGGKGGQSSSGAVMGVLIGGQPESYAVVSTVTTVQTAVSAITAVAGVVGVVGAVDAVVALVVVPILIT